jgi:hypothetical protein
MIRRSIARLSLCSSVEAFPCRLQLARVPHPVDQAEPFAPRFSARLKGCPHAFRPGRVVAPLCDAPAAVVRPFGQSFLLRLLDSAPLGYVPHLLLLHPFAFRQVLLSCLLLSVRSRLQDDVCFLCLPPGFPAVPPYLVHTFVASRQRATMSALTPPLHRTSGGSVPDPSASKSRSGRFLTPFGSFHSGCRPLRFFSSPDRVNRSRNGERRSPRIGRAAFCPRRPAQHPVSPKRTRSLRSFWQGASPPPAGWPSTGVPYIRVRSPTAQTFASNPPGPRLAATPCYFGYPAQERSTGTGLSPVSDTPCRAYECGDLSPLWPRRQKESGDKSPHSIAHSSFVRLLRRN